MDSIKICAIQTDLYWENPTQNINKIEKIINGITDKVDLFLLPEMFSTGFSVNATHIAENMNGETVCWMKKMSEKQNAVIAGSILIKENDKFYNRFLFVKPDSNVEYYDKRHLFRFSGENNTFESGKDRVIVEYKGFRFLLQTCYDIRFPVFMRCKNDYDAILVVASWPESRSDIWTKLLHARAIENLSYVIAVNRIGVDGLGYNHSGNSIALDYRARVIAEAKANSEEVIIATISKLELDDFRTKFPAHLDADEFTISI